MSDSAINNYLCDCVLTGRPLGGVLVIDEHAHMGPIGYVRDASPEGLIADMDSLGVDKSFVSHSMSLLSDMKWGNDLIIDATEKYPDRFIGYCTIHPMYPREVVPELERCFEHPGMVGIKLHPYCHGRPMSYRHYRPVYEFAAKRRLPVMTHTYADEDIAATDSLAPEFPEVPFIMAHMGGEGYKIERALEVAAKHANVYGDVAVSQSLEGKIEWFVKEAGAKKILFGTDIACMNPVATLCMVAMAEISAADKLAILGQNMQKILDGIIN